MIHPFIVICHNVDQDYLPSIYDNFSQLAEGKVPCVILETGGNNASVQIIPLCPGGHPGWIGKRLEVRVLEEADGPLLEEKS